MVNNRIRIIIYSKYKRRFLLLLILFFLCTSFSIRGSFQTVSSRSPLISLIHTSGNNLPSNDSYAEISQWICNITSSSIQDVFIVGSTAYLTCGSAGLIYLNVTTLSLPVLLSHYEDGRHYRDVFVKDNYAYITTYNDGVKIINMSDPTNPQKVGHFYDAEEVKGIFVNDSYAFIATGHGGIKIYNISNPVFPVQIAEFWDGESAEDVFVDGNLVFVADESDGLEIINVSDILNPHKIGQYSEEGNSAYKIVVENNYAYLLFASYQGLPEDHTMSVKIIDISTSNNPLPVSSYSALNLVDLFVSDGQVFLSEREQGLIVLGGNALEGLQVIGSYHDGGSLNNLFVSKEGFVFLADSKDGLEIIGYDSDNDQLADYSETELFGTNPTDEDSDDDGMTDGYEVNNQLDPLNPADANDDPDQDGLPNVEEFQNGSDLTNPDSDGDGLLDGEEVHTFGTDPIRTDSDADGLDDFAEITIYNTDPLSEDSDQDGLTDFDEVMITDTDPLEEDSDGDRLLDGWELAHDHDPLKWDNWSRLFGLFFLPVYVLLTALLLFVCYRFLLTPYLQKRQQ